MLYNHKIFSTLSLGIILIIIQIENIIYVLQKIVNRTNGKTFDRIKIIFIVSDLDLLRTYMYLLTTILYIICIDELFNTVKILFNCNRLLIIGEDLMNNQI